MIKEFAIQPEVMSTWAFFRELRADFEVGLGRLICRYPKSWTREVCTYVDHLVAEQKLGDVHGNAIKTFVSGEKHRFISARGRTYEPKLSWLENCERCTAPEPFHAIIANSNPRNRENVLVAGDFDRSQRPFAVAFQAEVPRLPDDMADCGRILLDVCEDLLLVDHFFSPWASRHGDTFRAMLAHATRRHHNIRRIEIHTGEPIDEKSYKRAFSDVLPPRSQLKVFRWGEPAEGIHARYLLTDLGGIQFDWGFDKGQLHTQLNEIILIQHQRWIELYGRYSSPPVECAPVLISSAL
jgi:hypothetical protein